MKIADIHDRAQGLLATEQLIEKLNQQAKDKGNETIFTNRGQSAPEIERLDNEANKDLARGS